MRNNTKEEVCTLCGQNQPLAEQIVKGVIQLDKPENLKNDLREMLDAFLLQEDEIPADERRRVYFSYTVLFDALNQIKIYAERWEQ